MTPEVIGNIDIATAGTHAFRLTSDDGSRLRIDGATVINHDGLHGPTTAEGGADSPGDGLPLTGVHPGHMLTDLRPGGFEPQVSAMDWLPDGRLAIATWGGTDNELGEVHLLSGVTGTTDPSRLTTRRVASGLREPMGIKYVDGTLYVSEKDGSPSSTTQTATGSPTATARSRPGPTAATSTSSRSACSTGTASPT